MFVFVWRPCDRVCPRRYGVLAAEVKAVGLGASGQVLPSVAPRVILERVWKGAEQMAKAKRVLAHVLSDLPGPQPQAAAPSTSPTSPSSSSSSSSSSSPSPSSSSSSPQPPRVRTTLVAPGLSRAQLRAAITNQDGQLTVEVRLYKFILLS